MPDEPIDAEIVPEPAPAPVPPPTDYTDGGVPTLDYVRDKIEGRYATALGMEELVGETEQARSLAEQEAARKKAAEEKLAEIRRSLVAEHAEHCPPQGQRLNSLLPSHTSGSYLRSTTRSFIGISALSVILMCSGQTSVQHLVMLQKPRPCSSCGLLRRRSRGVERVHVELGHAA